MSSLVSKIQKNFLAETIKCVEPLNTSPLVSLYKYPFESRKLLKNIHQRRCIFVHIPKCAGISISQNIFGYFPIGHRSIQGYKNILSSESFNQYFKFSIVRNPWDRLVSIFHFLKKGGWNDWDKKWAELYLSPYPDFDSFVHGWLNRKNIMTWFHFIPQHQYIYLDNLKMPMNFVGSYENLDRDFSFVCDQLKIKADLFRHNTSERKHDDYRKYYTAETRRIVANVYADDIRILGYSFDAAIPNISSGIF